MSRPLLLLAAILPLPLKLGLYRLLGWKIGRNVRIGLSYLDARDVLLGDGVHIGHFNIVKGLNRFHVGHGTYISNGNHFFGAVAYGPPWMADLIMGEGINFMSRHFFDVGGTVTVGDRCVIGGRDTQVWSHTRILEANQPRLVPTNVSIGSDVYVAARATLVSCDVPNGAIVAAGAVLVKSYPPEEDRLLLAGNPATIRKRYPTGEAHE